jgi:phosphoribosylanthranilate isomerase
MIEKFVIKICGINSVQDVDACVRCNVSAVGLNFYPSSPRYVSVEQAKELRSHLGKSNQAIGVFVRPTMRQLQTTVDRVGLDAIQIHGADEAYLKTLKPISVPIWLAHGVATSDDVRRAKEYVQLCRDRKMMIGALLLDAKSEDVHGGSGKTLPWDVLKDIAWDLPLILSGGLTPENVADAIGQVKPQGVDVASGVESAPGGKDAAKIEAFVAAARSAFEL